MVNIARWDYGGVSNVDLQSSQEGSVPFIESPGEYNNYEWNQDWMFTTLNDACERIMRSCLKLK